MKITRHAEKRLKERCGLNRESGRRMAQKEFDEGIRHSRTKGRLNRRRRSRDGPEGAAVHYGAQQNIGDHGCV